MRKAKLYVLILFFAPWWIANSVVAQESRIQEAITKAVTNYRDQTGFSGTILIAEKGVPLFHQSYGLAYLPAKDTIQNDYHYSIASITKLFTSIRILQLREAGKIELGKSVIDYLPELENRISKQVTVHHLLLHLSGLPNEKDKSYQHFRKPNVMVEAALENKSKASFNTFNYNNIDYMLLGLIIERVSEQSWEEEIRTNILDPLKMKHTGFLEYGYYPDHFAYTYSYKNKKQPVQDPFFYIENSYAAAAMYSTSMDLLQLDQALYSDTLLNPESQKLLEQSYPEHAFVGYGVWNYSYPFVDENPRIMERRGGIMGANVVLVRLLEYNKIILILSNDDRFNPDSFGDPTNLREALIQALFEMEE